MGCFGYVVGGDVWDVMLGGSGSEGGCCGLGVWGGGCKPYVVLGRGWSLGYGLVNGEVKGGWALR